MLGLVVQSSPWAGVQVTAAGRQRASGSTGKGGARCGRQVGLTAARAGACCGGGLESLDLRVLEGWETAVDGMR